MVIAIGATSAAVALALAGAGLFCWRKRKEFLFTHPFVQGATGKFKEVDDYTHAEKRRKTQRDGGSYMELSAIGPGSNMNSDDYVFR